MSKMQNIDDNNKKKQYTNYSEVVYEYCRKTFLNLQKKKDFFLFLLMKTLNPLPHNYFISINPTDLTKET